MNYSAQKLAKAFVEIISENPGDYQKSINNFLAFCQKSKLNYLLPSIIRYLGIEFKRQNNENTLKLFSATELNEEIIKKIKKNIKAESSCQVEFIKDKNMGAGFVANYRNKIIDASLENNLRLLKNKIING